MSESAWVAGRSERAHPSRVEQLWPWKYPTLWTEIIVHRYGLYFFFFLRRSQLDLKRKTKKNWRQSAVRTSTRTEEEWTRKGKVLRDPFHEYEGAVICHRQSLARTCIPTRTISPCRFDLLPASYTSTVAGTRLKNKSTRIFFDRFMVESCQLLACKEWFKFPDEFTSASLPRARR